MFQIHTGQGEGTVHTVQTLAEVGGQGESVAVDLNNVTEATLNQDGQLILTGEDGHGNNAFFNQIFNKFVSVFIILMQFIT